MSISTKGTVKLLYPTTDGYRFQLNHSGVKPREDTFIIKFDHPNFNALVATLIAGAVNRYELVARTFKEINQNAYGDVMYLMIQW